MREVLTSLEKEYRRYKSLAESAIAQLDEQELAQPAGEEGNSIAVLVWHVSGNLASRFTDFPSSDGEKPWRDRDAEFDARPVARAQLLEKWETGWRTLFATLGAMSDEDLTRPASIRGEPLSAQAALHRSLAHTAYHVGQIVLLAKSRRGTQWQNLSIPKRHAAEPPRD